jgi:hypothetical protein
MLSLPFFVHLALYCIRRNFIHSIFSQGVSQGFRIWTPSDRKKSFFAGFSQVFLYLDADMNKSTPIYLDMMMRNLSELSEVKNSNKTS